MGTDTPTTQQDKQITVDVPADRLPEFYAFFARFLAADGQGRRGRRGPDGPRGRHGHGPGEHHRRCHHPAHDDTPVTMQAEPGPAPAAA